MNYLAFDIEAANGYKLSSICSIGIVVADEQFNIVHRENIWINPRTKYNLNGTRENVGINLGLDKALLDSSPDFSQVYGRVKALLTDSRYMVLGHAVDSDVRMLNAACLRYNLPSINFEFICSQLLYKLYRGDKDVKALGKIAADIGVSFRQHNSEEDAYVSMMTLKFLVRDSGLSVEQLLDKYHIRKGCNADFVLLRPVSLEGQLSRKKVTQVAISAIKEFAAGVAQLSDEYEGLSFCLARSLELSGSAQMYQVVRHIVQKGGRYQSKLYKGNVYVSGEAAAVDVLRERRVEELVQQGQMRQVTVSDVLEDKL